MKRNWPGCLYRERRACHHARRRDSPCNEKGLAAPVKLMHPCILGYFFQRLGSTIGVGIGMTIVIFQIQDQTLARTTDSSSVWTTEPSSVRTTERTAEPSSVQTTEPSSVQTTEPSSVRTTELAYLRATEPPSVRMTVPSSQSGSDRGS